MFFWNNRKVGLTINQAELEVQNKATFFGCRSYKTRFENIISLLLSNCSAKVDSRSVQQFATGLWVAAWAGAIFRAVCDFLGKLIRRVGSNFQKLQLTFYCFRNRQKCSTTTVSSETETTVINCCNFSNTIYSLLQQHLKYTESAVRVKRLSNIRSTPQNHCPSSHFQAKHLQQHLKHQQCQAPVQLRATSFLLLKHLCLSA